MNNDTSPSRRKPRAGRACTICHRRKIRCDLALTGTACTNCLRDDQVCEPRERKRKVWTSGFGSHPSADLDSLGPRQREGGEGFESSVGELSDNFQPRRSRRQTRQGLSLPTYIDSPGDDGRDGFENMESVSLSNPREVEPARMHDSNAPTDELPQASTAATTSPLDSGYVGRAAYIVPEAFKDQDGVHVYSYTRDLSDTEKGMLELQRCFDLPPRPVRDGLLDNYWAFCHPWGTHYRQSTVYG